jgi:hypothetical protein
MAKNKKNNAAVKNEQEGREAESAHDAPSEIAARDPETPREWQEAVDLADFHLQLDAARQYGLVTGGPDVDVERCEYLLKQGKNLGYRPVRRS